MVCKRPLLIGREIFAFSFCTAVQTGAGRYKQALLMLGAAQTTLDSGWKMRTHVVVARCPKEHAVPLGSARQLRLVFPLHWRLPGSDKLRAQAEFFCLPAPLYVRNSFRSLHVVTFLLRKGLFLPPKETSVRLPGR